MQERNTLMAVLAYIGPLVIVSYLVALKDPFVKYHIKQGLVLFIAEVVIWVLQGFLWQFWQIYEIVNLVIVVLAIIGIINAAQGKEKELPLVGNLGHNFKI